MEKFFSLDMIQQTYQSPNILHNENESRWGILIFGYTGWDWSGAGVYCGGSWCQA